MVTRTKVQNDGRGFTMLKTLDIKNEDIAQIVLRLQKEAYRIEAEYIGTYELPPLKETLEQLINSGEEFIGYFIDDRLGGVLAYKYVKGVVDIHRVMVHPLHFRKGIARSLLRYIEDLYNGHLLVVSTGAKNLPAVELYLSLGFEKVDESVYGEGIQVANFKKRGKRDR
jgi:ribosomal protein S18 acetylase RimI-like enzyme